MLEMMHFLLLQKLASKNISDLRLYSNVSALHKNYSRPYRRFPLVPTGSPWLSLVILGYPWLSLVILGYPWLSLVIPS